MLPGEVYDELDARLGPVDDELRRRYPGSRAARQPVHTLYVPADRFGPSTVAEYGRAALEAVAEHGPLPFPDDVVARVLSKLEREPVEDLRVDFEDSYGRRDDAEEDAAARWAAALLCRDPLQTLFDEEGHPVDTATEEDVTE